MKGEPTRTRAELVEAFDNELKLVRAHHGWRRVELAKLRCLTRLVEDANGRDATREDLHAFLLDCLDPVGKDAVRAPLESRDRKDMGLALRWLFGEPENLKFVNSDGDVREHTPAADKSMPRQKAVAEHRGDGINTMFNRRKGRKDTGPVRQRLDEIIKDLVDRTLELEARASNVPNPATDEGLSVDEPDYLPVLASRQKRTGDIAVRPGSEPWATGPVLRRLRLRWVLPFVLLIILGSGIVVFLGGSDRSRASASSKLTFVNDSHPRQPVRPGDAVRIFGKFRTQQARPSGDRFDIDTSIAAPFLPGSKVTSTITDAHNWKTVLYASPPLELAPRNPSVGELAIRGLAIKRSGGELQQVPFTGIGGTSTSAGNEGSTRTGTLPALASDTDYEFTITGIAQTRTVNRNLTLSNRRATSAVQIRAAAGERLSGSLELASADSLGDDGPLSIRLSRTTENQGKAFVLRAYALVTNGVVAERQIGEARITSDRGVPLELHLDPTSTVDMNSRDCPEPPRIEKGPEGITTEITSSGEGGYEIDGVSDASLFGTGIFVERPSADELRQECGVSRRIAFKLRVTSPSS